MIPIRFMSPYSLSFSNKTQTHSPAGIQMGLTFDSLVVVDRTVFLKKLRIADFIGSCPQNIINRIENLLTQKKEDNK
jgi:hypothetical protein